MAHPDDCPVSVPFLEAAALDQHLADAHQPEPGAWDASACVRRDAAADGCPEVHSPQGACAGKLAARGLVVLAQGARRQWELLAEPEVESDARAPCRPDAGPSAARSCAAPEAVEQPVGLQMARVAEPMC
jgi:hypothetical protein